MKAYARSISVCEGGTVTLCVEPGCRFGIRFYRQTTSELLEPVHTPEAVNTAEVDRLKTHWRSAPGEKNGKPDEDWQWPWIEFSIPGASYPTAIYAAAVYEIDGEGKPIDRIGRMVLGNDPIEHLETNAALFVVTPNSPASSIAYILPIATMHAYNFTGGGCFYEYRDPHAPPCRTVSLRRPGCGIGGESREPPDPYDTRSPRQAFAHWDAKMLGWLRSNGFAVDCYTDLDLDQRRMLASGGERFYQLMISAGHHEYWSEPMRKQTQDFLDDGGNVAIFSGNTCYRKISFDAARASVTKENEAWPNSNEAELVGVSYSQGGGWWGQRRNGTWYAMERAPVGYTVTDRSHWVFDGVDLGPDSTFGAQDRLLGYECDGIVPGVSPSNITVLAEAKLVGGWNNGDGHTASMVLFESGRGTLFNASTTDWARILGNPQAESYAAVSQITRNVVSKLARS